MPGFEPQTDVQLTAARLHFLRNDTEDIPIFGVPLGANYQIELLSVSVAVGANRVAGGALTVQAAWVDDSASDAVATLGATANPEALTARILTQLWRGSIVLEAGDTVFVRCIADNNPVTFPFEETGVAEFRILRRS